MDRTCLHFRPKIENHDITNTSFSQKPLEIFGQRFVRIRSGLFLTSTDSLRNQSYSAAKKWGVYPPPPSKWRVNIDVLLWPTDGIDTYSICFQFEQMKWPYRNYSQYRALTDLESWLRTLAVRACFQQSFIKFKNSSHFAYSCISMRHFKTDFPKQVSYISFSNMECADFCRVQTQRGRGVIYLSCPRAGPRRDDWGDEDHLKSILPMHRP